MDALPHHIRLRLDQTLTQWRHWQCRTPLEAAPEAIAVLGRGISNFTILVDAGEQFAVRIDGVNPAANGLNRQVEWRALEAASDAGLAPAPRYFNPELGSLVCDYLTPDAEQPQDTGQLADLLRRIHQLPPRHHRLDLGERILRYQKQLSHRGEELPPTLVRLRPQLHEALDALQSQAGDLVLCHNDLLRANRLHSGGSLWALDWEYCAMGSPWYDLAVTICGDELDGEQAQALVRAYLGREPDVGERVQLRDYSFVYRYLELLWYLALEKAPAQKEGFICSRLAALEAARRTP
jgi:thiamine kinase-like enzyme